MKKLLFLLLFIVYGASSFGVTLHFHYCCGKLDKVDFTPPKVKHCSVGKNHKMGGKSCCDNKQLSLKIQSDQDPSKILQVSSQQFAALDTNAFTYLISDQIQTKNILPEIFAPPPLQKNIHQLYCIYRI